jgi:hypothetical protein
VKYVFRLLKRNAYEILVRDLKIRNHLKNLGVVGEVILQSILRRWIKKQLKTYASLDE